MKYIAINNNSERSGVNSFLAAEKFAGAEGIIWERVQGERRNGEQIYRRISTPASGRLNGRGSHDNFEHTATASEIQGA